MKSGMRGAMIVSVVLVLTVFAGYLTSVERTTETSIQYDYLTDGTSLLSYTAQPEYVEYSPNINYTHYTTDLAQATNPTGTFETSGIGYTALTDGRINQYRVFEALNVTTKNVVLSEMSFGSYVDSGTASHQVFKSGYQSGTQYWYPIGATITAPKVITLETLINKVSEYQEAGAIVEFDFGNGTNPSDPLSTSFTTWPWCGTNFQWVKNNTNNTVQIPNTTLTNSTTMGPYPYPWISKISYDVDANNCTCYRILNGTLTGFYTGPPSQIYLFYGGTYDYLTEPADTMVGDIHATITHAQAPTYMDVSAGVYLNNDTVYWTNGYGVGNAEILIKAPTIASDVTATLQIDGLNNAAGPVIVTYTNNAGFSLAGINLGLWPAADLSINFETGVATLSGVTSLASMTDYAVSTYSVHTSIASGVPNQLKFASLIDGDADIVPWQININSTRVWMNTYANIMQDPTVNLGNYFSTVSDLRLSINGVAYYGDSITINNQTFTVTNGKITVTVDDVSRSYDLTNVYISWESDNHTYLTFRNSNTVVDLGTTVNKVVSWGGDWYFTANVYSGHEVSKTGFAMKLGTWSFDKAAFILAFMGLLILAAMIIHVQRGLTWLDITVIVGAGIFAFILLG